MNMMNLDYGIYCVLCSVIGSFIGTIIIQKIIEKTERASILVILLVIVLLLSTILIPINTVLQMRILLKEGYSLWEFTSVCK